MSGTLKLPTPAEAWADINRAAELEGLSAAELIRKGADIYARQLLAKHDALPMLRPSPWRQFRVEDGGCTVSFRVRVPLHTFSEAAFIEWNVRKRNGGGYSEDACEIAESHMCTRLNNLPVRNKAERQAREKAYIEWLEAQGNLMSRLKEIEMEVEHA